jgi:pyruvate/2-oxoglutarate dehydrogenase complex dihydrolipoamide dehydrogenase (E3) component
LIVQKLAEVDRAVVENEESGFAKVLVAKGTDKVLGATLVCESAGDLLHEFVLAMKCRVGLGTISSTIHVYPTLAELARKIGDKYNKTRLTPTARKVFGWLYRRNLH